MIHILVVEKELLFREGLVSLIEEMNGMKVIGSVSSGEEAVIEMDKHQPDIVLTDHHLLEEDDMQAITEMKEHDPNIKPGFPRTHNEVGGITPKLS